MAPGDDPAAVPRLGVGVPAGSPESDPVPPGGPSDSAKAAGPHWQLEGPQGAPWGPLGPLGPLGP